MSGSSKVAPLLLALTLAGCKDGTSPDDIQNVVNFVLDFCAADIPAFVAVQNSSDGPWTRVTGDANGTFTLSVAPKFGLAVVYEGGINFTAEVMYTSREDLAFRDGAACPEQPLRARTLSGSLVALTGTQQAEVYAYDLTVFMQAGGATGFQFNTLPSLPLDLVAIRLNGPNVDRVILRRNLAAATTATTPALDFTGNEGIVVATSSAAITGAGTDGLSVDRYFHSSLGTSTLMSTSGNGSAWTFTSVPTAQTIDGDMQELQVLAMNQANGSGRGVRTFFRAAGDLSTTIGPALATPAVTFSGTPRRPRLQMTSQSDYGAVVLGFFVQGLKAVTVAKTSGYVGVTPSTWDVEFPDLSAVTGFPGGGLTAGSPTDWFVVATGAPLSFALGGVPVEGLIAKDAAVISNSTAFSGSTRSARLLGSRMRGVQRGY